jgi:DNA-binding NarL/FixJ family response regulator
MNVIIADDHPLTLMGTKSYIESIGVNVLDICSNGITALNMICKYQPDIAILDINMPGLDGIEVLEKVLKQKLKTKIILLTMHKELLVYKKASALGVDGYILKEYAHEELKLCFDELNNGNKYIRKNLINELEGNDSNARANEIDRLTLAENKILVLISKQKTSKQISEQLFISEKTVEGHRSSIIQKLELPKEKNALLIWAMKHLNKL